MFFLSRYWNVFKVRKIEVKGEQRNWGRSQGKASVVVKFPERNGEMSCPESSERIFQNIKILTFQTIFEDSNRIEKQIGRKMIAYRGGAML